MTGNLSLLCNFVEKYLGTVHFGNDQFAPILGYGDLVQGNITIKRVYYVEGLNHNLFSVGQFCDADLEKRLHQLQSVSWLKHHQLKRGYGIEDFLISTSTTLTCFSKKDVVMVYNEDETPEVLKDFLTMIQRNLQASVIFVRTDRGIEFLNKTLNAFFKEEGIEHQTSTPRTPEQNGRWCENLDKDEEKGDTVHFRWDTPSVKGYRVYNKRTRLIVESIHLRFDEIKEMSETSVANDTSGLELDLLFGPLYDEFFNHGTSRVNKSSSHTDNSAPQDIHPSLNIHPTSQPSTPTNVYAEENNDNQAEFTNPFCTTGGGLCCTPDGFVDPDHLEKVYRLRKALNGLKQALRAWYDELSNFLISKGFTKGLWYLKGSGFKLIAFSDADHADCVDTRKSTSGGTQFLEAEYLALSASYAQVMWMQTQLQDYGFNYNKITIVLRLLVSHSNIIANPVQHSRTKHIHTRYHFIKEQVENGISELYFVRTEYQLADMFTKALLEEIVSV
ncbi:retrovirus-related pol polyprotein from transposon TNT 1-94 [Tanacetum coccineum]